MSPATRDFVEGRLGPITRGICELVATRCWRARRRAPSALTRLRMPGLRRRFDTCVAQPWLFPPSFLRRRLVRFGPDPTKVNAHSLASLAPSCAAGYSASVPTRRMELRTASPPSLRLAPQASRLRDRPDDRNCAQLRLPRSFLRRRLLRFVPTRRMELRTASLPSLIFAPQATRLRLRASGVGVRLLGLRVSQCVCVAACGQRERGQASFGGASRRTLGSQSQSRPAESYEA